MSTQTRNRPPRGEAVPKAGGPDTKNTATLDTVAAWPPCEGTAVIPHVDIRELDRRRYWHNRLEAHLGRRAA